MQTQSKENNIIKFGLENYNLDIQSDIYLTGYEEGKKEIVILVKKLLEKIEFIKNDELINSIILNEKKELENIQKSENNNFEKEENYSSSWEGSFNYNWEVLKADILGQPIYITYENDLSNGTFRNQLVLKTNYGEKRLGNPGKIEGKTELESNFPDLLLFTVPFPGCPIPVSFNLILSGSIGFSVSFDPLNSQFIVSLNGEISVKAEINIGIKTVISISFGAQGVLLNIGARTNIIVDSSGSIPTGALDISAGKVTVYIQGKVSFWKIFDISITIFNGWAKTIEIP